MSYLTVLVRLMHLVWLMYEKKPCSDLFFGSAPYGPENTVLTMNKHCPPIASIVTRSQLNRTPLGCARTENTHHRCIAETLQQLC